MGKRKHRGHASDVGKRVTVTRGYHHPSDRGDGTIVGREGHLYTVQMDSGERIRVPESQLRNIRGRGWSGLLSPKTR